MGSIFAADGNAHFNQNDVLVNGFSEEDGLSFADFNDLDSGHNTTTGMREDIVLTAWLIVLLRTREGSLVSFDWAYKSSTDGNELVSSHKRLSMDKVMGGLQDSVSNVSRAMLDQVSSTGSLNGSASGTRHSLLLSTSSLSQQPEESQVRS